MEAYEGYRDFFLGNPGTKTEQLSGLSVLVTKGFKNWICYRRSGNRNYQEEEVPLKKNSSPIAENELVLLLATLIGGGMNNE